MEVLGHNNPVCQKGDGDYEVVLVQYSLVSTSPCVFLYHQASCARLLWSLWALTRHIVRRLPGPSVKDVVSLAGLESQGRQGFLPVMFQN